MFSGGLLVLEITRRKSTCKQYFSSTVEVTSSQNSCAICLEENGMRDPIELECNHSFCFVCILNLNKLKCPICRMRIIFVKYHGVFLHKSDLVYFGMCVGYVLPTKVLSSSLAAVTYSREFPQVKQRLRDLIELFFDELCCFEIIN